MKLFSIKISTLLFLCFLLFLFAVYFTQAKENNSIITTSKFADVINIINELDDPKSTLLVMDDDDTLSMIRCTETQCQYLGGPAWYSWQSNLLTTKSVYRVADKSEDLLKISTLLLSINYMVYPELDIPEVLESLSDSGVKLLVETARGPKNLSATVNQFTHLQPMDGSSYDNLLDLINENSLMGSSSNMTSLASPFMPCEAAAPSGTRAVSYQQGVMYAAGQNKGVMLNCLLQSTESSDIKNIVFIDDTLKNVEYVFNQFVDSQYKIRAIHYTALAKHKAALTEGAGAKLLQETAWARWEAIKTILDIELVDSAIPTFNNNLISEEN